MYIFGCNYNEPTQLLHEVKACSLKINIRAYIRSDGPEKISLKKQLGCEKRGRGRVAPPPLLDPPLAISLCTKINLKLENITIASLITRKEPCSVVVQFGVYAFHQRSLIPPWRKNVFFTNTVTRFHMLITRSHTIRNTFQQHTSLVPTAYVSRSHDILLFVPTTCMTCSHELVTRSHDIHNSYPRISNSSRLIKYMLHIPSKASYLDGIYSAQWYISSSSIPINFRCAQVVQPFLATDTHEPMFTFSVFFILIIKITVLKM